MLKPARTRNAARPATTTGRACPAEDYFFFRRPRFTPKIESR
jgi:hypothetical protein